MDKAALFAAFRAHLQGLLEAIATEGDAARAGTRVDGDHRPENRGERAAVTNQGYLTLALGKRQATLREQLDLLDRIPPTARSQVVTGALFQVEDDDEVRTWFVVLPGGQGLELDGVTVISPDSPIARGLWGLTEGDADMVVRGRREAELEILAVR